VSSLSRVRVAVGDNGCLRCAKRERQREREREMRRRKLRREYGIAVGGRRTKKGQRGREREREIGGEG